jgi:asparagine synthase (glutamine-hydrolysing)
MCGFFISNSTLVNESHESVINQCIGFRGPDGTSGLKKIGSWKSFHARLSIIDLSEGSNQPVINEDQSQLVFNGEILNYKELGFKYFDREYYSDTYLLNDLILNKKLNLKELDGFFAFVFVNSKGELEYACRDKFGVKPLFYHKCKNEIALSSEPSALKNIFNCSVNEVALEEYKVFRAPIFSNSFYTEIKEVCPGSCYVNGNYFDLSNALSVKSDKKTTETNLPLALKRGVNSRCVSDAPIGLLLSKGIDSNLIRYYGQFNAFYSIGFDGDEDIKFLEKQSINNLTIIKVGNEEFKEAFYYLLSLRQEPMSVPNEVMLYIVAKKAKEDGIKVLLSGEGADEFFAGYDRIFLWASQKKEFDLNEFLSMYAYGRVARESTIFNQVESIFENCTLETVFEKVRWFFIRYHMPVLFRRLDFSLMAAGVEGREPLANTHLFDICKTLTHSDLLFRNLGKKPLREELAKHMGIDFAFEKKVGFPVDLKKIFHSYEDKTSYDLWFEKNLEVLK